MLNICIYIIGGIFAIVGIILLITMTLMNSSIQGMIKEIDQTVKICSSQKQYDQLKDGELVFISGEYENKEYAFDEDFIMRFKDDTIIKRTVERLQSSSIFRLLQGINLENKNNHSKELQFLEDINTTSDEIEKKQLRCKENFN